MRFLALNLRHMPFYQQVLDRLRTDPSANFLDAGCCFGQEIRSLADQGVPSRQLFGCDLEKPFIDLGYQLFRDQDRLEATFAAGNLTADDAVFAESELSRKMAGKMDIIFASSLFHLWDYETGLVAAKRLIKLCRDKPGVIITGRQVGSLLGGHYPMLGVDSKAFHYRHNFETLKGFWKDIEEATQTRWRVEASYIADDAIEKAKNALPGYDENTRVLCWSATRLA